MALGVLLAGAGAAVSGAVAAVPTTVALTPAQWARAAHDGCRPHTLARSRLVVPRLSSRVYADVAAGRKLSAAERRAFPKVAALIARNFQLNQGQTRAIARLMRPPAIAASIGRVLRAARAAEALGHRGLALFRRRRPSFLPLMRRAAARGATANRILRRLGAYVCAG